MTPGVVRAAVAVVAMSWTALGVPIYPGAKRDVPQALIETSAGVEAAAVYLTADGFEKVDSFYRAHGVEDKGARRISASSKRSLFYFADSKADVLVTWPRSQASDETSITISQDK